MIESPTTCSAARPRSEAQREAARRNGACSRGPSTAEGKAISRRNALRHGHRAEIVLPDDLNATVEAEVALFTETFHPRDAYERRALTAAATASARLRRLEQAELDRTDELVRTAVERWDARRAEEIRDLAARLDSDPTALPRLRSTCEGCDYLGDSWDALIGALEAEGRWTQPEAARARILAGDCGAPDPAHAPAAARLVELATLASGPDPIDPDDLDELRAILDTTHAELIERGDHLWESYDKPSRQAAPTLAYFDPSPEGRLLFRYRVEAERAHRRALAEFHRHRRQKPNEPGMSEGPRASDRTLPGRAWSRMFADSTASGPPSFELLDPLPNEPEPSRDEPPIPMPSPRDPAARKRRPDPRELLRRSRR